MKNAAFYWLTNRWKYSSFLFYFADNQNSYNTSLFKVHDDFGIVATLTVKETVSNLCSHLTQTLKIYQFKRITGTAFY